MLLSTKESTNRQGEKKKEWPITSTKEEEEEEEGQSDQKLPGTLCRASSPAASPNASINFSSPRKIEKAEKKSYKKKNLGWMDAMQMGVGWMILSPTGIWRVGGWMGSSRSLLYPITLFLPPRHGRSSLSLSHPPFPIAPKRSSPPNREGTKQTRSGRTTRGPPPPASALARSDPPAGGPARPIGAMLRGSSLRC